MSFRQKSFLNLLPILCLLLTNISVYSDDPVSRASAEITIKGKGDMEILNKDMAPSTDDGTDMGSVGVETRDKVSQTFTIQNDGDDNLTLTGTPIVKITGSNAADFGVTQNPQTTIAGHSSTTFDITFAPSAGGVRNATLTIANNDSNENPYTFAIRGTGKVPNMNLSGNGYPISKGDTTPSTADGTDFGPTNAENRAVENTFSIENTGNTDLVIRSVQITGTNADDFVVTENPSSPIPPSNSATFKISFKPRTRGTRSATVSISNNDQARNPYTFAVKGNSLSPEINILGNGVSIAKGDSSPTTSDGTDFGSADAKTTGVSVTHTFTIQNQGNANLVLSGSPLVEISGDHASDFTVTQAPASTINPAKTTTFKIEFKPQDAGARNALAKIQSNDLDESVYTFAIKGIGLIPDIDVLGNGQDIENGDDSPTPADGTDFGYTDLVKASVVKKFTIKNMGTGKLTIHSVSLSGTNKEDFKVSTNPASSVAVGASTTFKITFTPNAGGLRNASARIYSNDPDEEQYTFSIQGTGKAPAIQLKGNGNDIPNGDTSPNASKGTDFGSLNTGATTGIAKTYKIQNLGAGKLYLTGSPLVKIVPGTDKDDFVVNVAPASTVNSESSVTFQVTFKPKGGGIRTATVSISSNDADKETYTFSIQGKGLGATEMDVQGNGKSITDGDTTPSQDDHTDFGSVPSEGGTVTRTFTIQNTGDQDLNLTGTPKVSITGTNAADFTVTTQPTSPVASGSSVTFDIKFDPGAKGERKATVNIANNDSNENPYNFAIKGSKKGNPGDVDFKILTSISGDDNGNSIAIQDDGKIVIAGESFNFDHANTDFAVIRYNSDGTLDSSFGNNGKVTTAIGSADDEGNAVAIQNDGKIVVIGKSLNGNDADFALVRYNSNGSLDTSFGNNGKVTTDISGYDDKAKGIAIQNDGKIIVVGSSNTNGTNTDFGIVRYNSDGTLDSSFGSNGILITDVSSSKYDDIAEAVEIQSDGKIVIGGRSSNSTSETIAAARYNSNGTLDYSFGSNGIVITDVSSYDDNGNAMKIQDDGKIVVVGVSNTDFVVVRYNTNGTLDSSFGSNGIVTTDLDGSEANEVAIQSDNKIIVAGEVEGGSGQRNFVAVRYNTDGSLDSSFGNNGVVTTDFGYDDEGHSVTVQADGNIVFTGSCYKTDEKGIIGLVRYYGDSKMTAHSCGDYIHIAWNALHENEGQGYYVMRSETRYGEYTRLNGFIIPFRGGENWGASYEYNDFAIVPGKEYYYKIEWLHFDGKSTLSEPIFVKAK